MQSSIEMQSEANIIAEEDTTSKTPPKSISNGDVFCLCQILNLTSKMTNITLAYFDHSCL